MRAVSNPPNPWSRTETEYLGEPPVARLQVFEEACKRFLNENQSPDLPFRFSGNPYHGCTHACAYCYARPAHQYRGFGAGTDFDTKIVVKTNAPEALERHFTSRSWRHEPIMLSGNTDCYQPLEAEYQLTRRCLEVCLRHANPVGIITKGALVRRDVDLLESLAAGPGAHVHLSIPFIEESDRRLLEPGASSIKERLKSMAALAKAGVPVGVAVAPVIPGLSDRQMVSILEAASDAGATMAFSILLRLPAEAGQVFWERMAGAYSGPQCQKVENQWRGMKFGDGRDSSFGTRMSGTGARWQATRQLFESTCRRLGLAIGEDAHRLVPNTRRGGQQLSLLGMLG